MKRGRQPNGLREAIIERLKMQPNRVNLSRDLPLDLAEQVDRCADDSARRLILGISEKERA